jgi:hypothetical protein
VTKHARFVTRERAHAICSSVWGTDRAATRAAIA